MHVRLKGLNKVRKQLADGSTVTYHYAWKGGPRLPGKPGSSEFLDANNQFISEKSKQPEDVLLSILRSYQESQKFKDLAERTRRDYVRMIKKIEAEYGDFPIVALSDPRTRGEFLSWRDRMSDQSRRQADYALSVLALILAWSFDRGIVPCNPCERPGKVYRSKRIDSIWSEDDEKAFVDTAPKHLRLALALALWTGQRQGDLLKLPWSAYDGETIRLRQSKTGTRVTIPVGAPLRLLLDQTTKTTVTILSTTRRTAWTESGFRASWRTACKNAKVEGVTFHDLRGTAVTRLAIAGCSESEISAITGHALRDVNSIIDSTYLHRDPALGISAIRKLELYEERTKIPN